MLRELSDSEIGLRAKMAEIAGEERQKNAAITEEILADRIAQRCLFPDCDSWIRARRDIRDAGPSLGLDK